MSEQEAFLGWLEERVNALETALTAAAAAAPAASSPPTSGREGIKRMRAEATILDRSQWGSGLDCITCTFRAFDAQTEEQLQSARLQVYADWNGLGLKPVGTGESAYLQFVPTSGLRDQRGVEGVNPTAYAVTAPGYETRYWTVLEHSPLGGGPSDPSGQLLEALAARVAALERAVSPRALGVPVATLGHQTSLP